MGPPGKPGLEGGLGPVGSIGPRGITVHGKMVGNFLKCVPIVNEYMYMMIVFCTKMNLYSFLGSTR